MREVTAYVVHLKVEGLVEMLLCLLCVAKLGVVVGEIRHEHDVVGMHVAKDLSLYGVRSLAECDGLLQIVESCMVECLIGQYLGKEGCLGVA